ncbi:hypothetical protein VST7929_02834 [Vibrio stylophorae]|uniref:Anti-sigma factor antagonist n=1 Tax=Vibrio stylophorae TaxID=659351 RepID=A0ABM8ZX12_9VIBR|nr:STAS domain-containing protein [Vibrio stylophorae]CAH0535173.1 hypothetical protein VST7929_02834 [Vibrio stylophorae]
MQYRIEQRSECTILFIDEMRFDAVLAPEFREVISHIIEDMHAHLVLDLSKVAFMDSSGLGAIMTVYKMLNGGKISILNPQRAVRDLLQLTRMDDLLACHESLDSAIA